MMQLVKPIDIEDALRIDLGALMDNGWRVSAPPAPDDLGAKCIVVTSLGGAPETAVSNEHDVSVDVWAATEADAISGANDAAGYIASLPVRTLASGRHYLTAAIEALPYINPDPNRPLVPRATFRATVGVRGTALF